MHSNPQIDVYGNKYWYNEKGELHRDDDLPAVEWENGNKWWYKNGERHREQDKPAIELKDGTRAWFKYGLLLCEQDVQQLHRKWVAIRNGNTDLLAEVLLDEL